MKVAALQTNPVWEDPAASRGRFAPMLEEAAGGGAELLILPELFASGFTPSPDRVQEAPEGPTHVWLSEQARRLGVFLVGSVVEIRETLPRNVALAFGPDGALLARYAKVHPFTFAGEHKRYARGDEVVVFSLGPFRAALAICYDLRFPELFREAVLAGGADLFLIPANWPVERRPHWDLLLRSRALENLAFVAAANRVGEGGGLSYDGGSAMIDCLGEVLARGEGADRIVTADLDPRRARQARERYHFLDDIRAGLYPRLAGRTAPEP